MSLRSPRHVATGLVLGSLVLFGALLTGCGDDGDDAAADTTAITSGYEEIPMAEVLDQLPQMLAAGEAADAEAEAGDFDAVLERYEELHEVWERVEGTVKATDRDLYAAIETAQSLIKDGGENEDAERVATGVADQADMVGLFIEGNE